MASVRASDKLLSDLDFGAVFNGGHVNRLTQKCRKVDVEGTALKN